MRPRVFAVLIVAMTSAIVATASPADSVSQADSIRADSIVDEIIYVPEAVFGTLVLNDTLSLVLQAGFGSYIRLNNDVDLAFAVKVGIVQSPSIQGYWSGVLHVGWKPQILNDPFRTTLIGTLGYGGVDAPTHYTLQNVVGVDVRYPIKRKDKPGRPLVYAVAIAGYGVDYLQEVNHGFVNLGIAIDGWVAITFDVASLFTESSSIIHVGRLR